MPELKKIDLTGVSAEEKEVLLLLERLGRCQYGEIARELGITAIKSSQLVYSLTTKGLIRNYGTSSSYELTGELMK